MDFGFFVIDTKFLTTLLAQPVSEIIAELITLGAWLILFFLLFFVFLYFLAELKEGRYTKSWQWVLLAVDIPQLNVQTPLAVEQMFSHIAGAYESPGIREKFFDGYRQRWFSFEIISIEGYIQFLVRTEIEFRDLIEAAVYAQYPQAEITEVEDYIGTIPDVFPNNEYELWAADFVTAEDDALPIRTYREFEHNISKDTVLKDPMGTFLESFSRIGLGEQMWFQILVEPVGSGWKEKAIKKIKEMIGEKVASKRGITDAIADAPVKLIAGIGTQVFGPGTGEAPVKPKEDRPNQLQYFTPGQSKLVEAMEAKIGKLGFKTKMRAVYVARKEVFRPSRGVNALIGAVNQFNIPTANSIVPESTTSAPSKKKSDAKKTAFLKAYKKRKISFGAKPFVLNIEELATVWHFPMSHVATPMLQKAHLKTAEPPSGLPVEMVFASSIAATEPEEEVGENAEAVRGKRYQTDAGDSAYDDDDGVRLG